MQRLIILILIFSSLSLFSQSSPSISKQNENVTTESLKQRRDFLNWHQLAGLSTLALWLVTNLEGEKAANGLYRKSDEFAQMILLTKPEYANADPLYAVALGSLNQHSIAADYLLLKDPVNNAPLYFALKSNEEWEAKHSASLHRNLASATFGMYALTAGLAYFAPSRIESEDSSSGSRIYSPLIAHKAMIPVHLLSMLMLPSLGMKIGKEGPHAAQQMSDLGWAGFGALSIAVLVITF
jgi:hypothetical protein